MARVDNVFVIGTELNLDGLKKGYAALERELKVLEGKFKSANFNIVSNADVKNVEKIGDTMTKAATAMENLRDKSGQTGHPIKNVNNNLRGTSNALADVGRRVFVWGSLSAAIFGAIQNVKEFLDITIQINSAMAELKKILPRETDFAFLKTKAFEFSIEFGQDPLDTIKTLRRFGQAGLSAAESIDATRAAMIGLNTTGAETEQIISGIIAANRIFGVGFDQAANIMDKVQRIQADFALDAKDLIAAITAIGPAAQVLGGTINDVFGMVAGLSEAARVSGKEAANSLKRVFSRIVSKEGIAALQEIGVVVRATDDSFRPLKTILNETAVALKNATQEQKVQVAVTLAQVRQYPKFLALLGNWDRAMQAVEKSTNAFGDATNANQIVMASYAKRLAVSTAKTTEFFDALFSRSLAPIKVSFAEATAGIIGLGKGFEGLISVVGGVGSLFVASRLLKSAIVGFTGPLKEAFRGFGLLDIAFFNVRKRIQEVTKEQKVSLSAGKKWAGALGVVALAALVLVPVVSKIKDEVTRFSRAAKLAAKDVQIFKESLSKLNVKGVAESDVDSKFKAITDAISEFGSKFGKAENAVKLFGETFKDVFKDIDLTNLSKLTDEELNKIQQILAGTKDVFTRALTKPLKEEAVKLKDFYKDTFDGIAELLLNRKLDIDKFLSVRGKTAEDLDPLSSAVFGSDKTRGSLLARSSISGQRLIEQIGLRKDIEKEFKTLVVNMKTEMVKAASEGVSAWLVSTGEVLTKWSGVLDVLERAALGTKAIQNATDELAKSITAIQSLRIDLAFADDLGKIFVKSKIEEQVKKGVAAFNSIIPIQAVVAISANRVFKEVGKATGEYAKFGSQAAALTPIMRELISQVDKAIEANIDASKVSAENIAAIGRNAKQTLAFIVGLKKSADLRTFVANLSPVSILSAVRRSIDVVTVGYYAQIEAINQVGKATKTTGGVFNVFERGLKATSAAINTVIKNVSSSAAELAKLRAEQATLEGLVASSINIEDITLGTGLETFGEKIKNIKARAASLENVMKDNNLVLADTLTILTRTEKAYKNIVIQQKIQQDVTKDNFKATEAFANAIIKANKSLISSPVQAFKANERLFEAQKTAQIKSLARLVVQDNLEGAEARRKIASINREFKLASLMRLTLAVIEEEGKKYRANAKAVDSILKARLDIKKSTIDAALELDKLRIGEDSTKLLAAELSAVERKKKAALEDLKIKQKLLGLSETSINLEERDLGLRGDKLTLNELNLRALREEIEITSNLERAQASINAILDDAKKKFVGLKSDTAAIRDIVVTWLTDQEALLDDLQSKGSLLRILGRAAGGIADVIIQRDAENIANSMTQQIDKFVKTARGGIREGFEEATQKLSNTLVEVLNSTELPAQLVTAVSEGGKGIGDNLVAALENLGAMFKLHGFELGDGFIEAVTGSGLFENKKLDTSGLKGIPKIPSTAGIGGGTFRDFLQEMSEKARTKTDELIKKIAEEEGTTRVAIKEQTRKLVQAQRDVFAEANLVPADATKGLSNVGRLPGNDLSKFKGLRIPSPDFSIPDLTEGESKLSDITTILTPAILDNTEALKENIETNKISISSKGIPGVSSFFESIDLDTLNKEQLKSFSEATDNAAIALEEYNKTVNKSNANLVSIVRLGATMMNSVLAQSLPSPSGAQAGGNIGLVAGTAISSNPLVGVGLSVLGNILGGIFGPKEEQEKQTEELAAIKENTAQLVDRLSPEIFNAPSNFKLPSGTGFGGEVSITNHITVSGGNLSRSDIDNLTDQINGIYSRSATKNSILK